MKLYRYGIFNGESYEDAYTYELYSTVKIDKDEWAELLHTLFRKGYSATGVYNELLKTDKFFRLEELISIEAVVCATIGMEFSEDKHNWKHNNPDACYIRKFSEYEDGSIKYIQKYLIVDE